MGRITQCRPRHNTPRRRISAGICPHPENSRRNRHAKPATHGHGPVFDFIKSHIPPGSDRVTLLQITIAAGLDISPVTVRRHTRKLEAAGLLSTRRTNHAITYILHERTHAQPDHKPDARETPPPGTDHDHTPQAAANPKRPVCRDHKASRYSDWSADVGRDVYHCTKMLEPGRRCSWVHVVGIGEVRAPKLAEWTKNDLIAHLANLDGPSRDAESRAETHSLPPQSDPDPASLLWDQVLAIISDQVQPHYIDRYLRKAAPIELQSDTLVVAAPTRQDAQWLSSPINQRWSDRALSQVLQRTATVQYFHG